MLVASIPYKFATPWAASAGAGYITATIPPTAASPAASQVLGFPPATATPIGSGGTPPSIADFNGAMNYATAWAQWQQAGGPIGYDSTFSTAITGYPKGAMLAQAAILGQFWVSTVDNNTSNPDTGGANWLDLLGNHGSQVITTTGNFTVPASVTVIDVELWAGGGGSGGANGAGSGSGGGASGGYTKKRITGLVPGAVITVTIGVGGNAGTAAPTSGTAGGNSSFGAYCSATGGAGGLGATGTAVSNPVTPGSGTGGDLNVTGGGPTQPFTLSAGIVYSATGGAPYGVPGSVNGWSSSAAPGVGGNFPGGGAAGAVNGAAGAAGAAGLCIVRW